MNASVITDDVLTLLQRRFGARRQIGRGNVFSFGTSLTCSISYSRLLGGHKYFYAVPRILLQSESLPKTELGEFVLLVCGSAEKILVLPRTFVHEMLSGVPSRRVDVFVENDAYILQTTQHPKRDVTDFLNAFPNPRSTVSKDEQDSVSKQADRAHLKTQWSLIVLGRAEGCSVWVPINDRNLSYRKQSFSSLTLSRLPNFGFEENTRRIVQNIDVLWLAKNVIRKAFEIESTTSIYSGLLRLNDLVLSQPNNQIDLYIAASQQKRDRVFRQLIRPTFQPLIAACSFLSFENIEKHAASVQSLSLDTSARISGLVRGEKFVLPEHIVYPNNF